MGIVVAAILSVVAAAPAEDIRAAAKAELEHGYQTELPHGLVRTKVPVEDDQKKRDVSLRTRRAPTIPIVNALLWALSVACVGLLAFFLVREFFGYLPDAEASAADQSEEAEPDAEVVMRPLGDAEALARRGLFGEAIHTLLLRTLEELKRREPRSIPGSLTSREILARVSIPEQARSALSGLISAVELTHFGGRAPSQADYAGCLDSFHLFARAYMGAL